MHWKLSKTRGLSNKSMSSLLNFPISSITAGHNGQKSPHPWLIQSAPFLSAVLHRRLVASILFFCHSPLLYCTSTTTSVCHSMGSGHLSLLSLSLSHFLEPLKPLSIPFHAGGGRINVQDISSHLGAGAEFLESSDKLYSVSDFTA